MTTTPALATCPIAGCISTHEASTTVHYKTPVSVDDSYGKSVAVGLAFNSEARESVVEFGDYEFTPDDAVRAAAELLSNALLAYRLEGGDRAGLKQALLELAVNRTALAELVRLSGGDR
jgi:hypothetical protein